MLVERYMTRDPVCVAPDEPVAAAARALQRGGFRHLPVVAGGKLVGILSDRDVLAAGGGARPVREVMTRDPETISPRAAVDEAARRMRRRRIHALPVVERGGRLVGIITSADVLDAFVRLSGVAEPSHLLEVTARQPRKAERKVREIALRLGAEIRWVHTDRSHRPPRLRLRVRRGRIDELVTALEAEGFDVAVELGNAAT